MSNAIPIIDFGDFSILNSSTNPSSKVANELYYALATAGFVYLKNTGISKESVNQVNEVTKTFFEAPLVEKNRYRIDITTNHGYDGVGVERVNPMRPADYKEAFNINGWAIDQFDVKNWPLDISPLLYNVVRPFVKQCEQLTLNIFEALAIGMQLKNRDFFKDSHSSLNKIGNATTLRSLYYPPVLQKLKPGQIRLGEHSDYGSITLLFQDQVGGLQVESLDGQYINAVPIDDTVLINIGDVLEYWTNNKLKSTKHRVIIPENEKRNTIRRSLVYFVQPDDNVIVNSPIEYQNETLNVKNKKSVEPITSLQYLNNRLSNTY